MKKTVIKLAIIFAVSFGLNGVVQAETEYESNNVELNQNFKNVDIKVVIEAVAKLTGRNYIIDQRVKGKVTLIAPKAMSPKSLNETLMSILRVHGYVAIPGENAISIVPANLARDRISYKGENLEKDSWITEVIEVRNVSASKLVAVLRPLVAREGHLVAMQESNNLIVTDSIKNISRIKKIIRKVDVNTAAGYEILKVRHGSAEEMVKTIKSVMPKPTAGVDLKINFDERSNNIVLSGDSKTRKGIVSLISQLDIPIESAGRVQVVYLRYAKAEDLVPVLQKISTNRSLLNSADENSSGVKNGAKPSAKVTQIDSKTLKDSISIEADERVNAVIISAPPQVLGALKDVIKQLDIRRAQVLIEAILVEVSEDKAAQLGVEWALNGPNGVGMIDFSGTIPALLGAAATGGAGAVNAATTLGKGSSVFVGEHYGDNRGWGALLRALNSDSSSNVLATPSIMTLDNEEAEIIVGREVPFTTGSYTSSTSGGSNPFSTVERKNVGLKLKVKPQINEGDEVFLEIDQEVSDVLPKGDAVDLQTSKRQIKTNVIVGDGNIIVLGGLLTERETDVVSKIPGLGDIPFLGGLFTSKQTKREKVNLMIFLRPVIIRDNKMSNYYARKKYSRIRHAQEQMLETDSGMVQGLRPHLPSIEQWKNNEPAKPYVSKKALEKSKPVDPFLVNDSEFDILDI